jgi:DeoR/GlpR family transcriptional regulator of sugar metabolism
MIEQARQRIVVADHTKFGKVMLMTVASLTVVDKIITGSEVDREIVTRLQQIGVEVVLA